MNIEELKKININLYVLDQKEEIHKKIVYGTMENILFTDSYYKKYIGINPLSSLIYIFNSIHFTDEFESYEEFLKYLESIYKIRLINPTDYYICGFGDEVYYKNLEGSTDDIINSINDILYFIFGDTSTRFGIKKNVYIEKMEG